MKTILIKNYILKYNTFKCSSIFNFELVEGSLVISSSVCSSNISNKAFCAVSWVTKTQLTGLR